MSSRTNRSGGQPVKQHYHTGVPAAGKGGTRKDRKMGRAAKLQKVPLPDCRMCGKPTIRMQYGTFPKNPKTVVGCPDCMKGSL